MTIVPYLLTIYFDTMITFGGDDNLQILLPVLFQRMDQLFPFEQFQVDVRKVLEAKVLAIINQNPRFVVTLKVKNSETLLINST